MAGRYDAAVRAFCEYAQAQGTDLHGEPATEEMIERAEHVLGSAFPESFRRFQREFGHLERSPLDIYAVRADDQPVLSIVAINRRARTELFPRLPPRLVAFSDNGGGDYLCFDTAGRVVWWDHEQDKDQAPEPAANGFAEWLEAEIAELAAEDGGVLETRLHQAGLVARRILAAWRRGR